MTADVVAKATADVVVAGRLQRHPRLGRILSA
jgi:hypothetical protein